LQQTLAQLAETKVKLSELEESWLGWQEELEQVLAQIDAQYAQTAP
jgi:ABC transporter, ATP-binding protein